MADFALKLISIPASSAEVERVFSNWKFVHSTLRNKLEFKKSKKLVEIYYNLNKGNSDEPDDSDEDDF